MDNISETLEKMSNIHVERIVECLKQPTIFNDHTNIQKCAEIYANHLKQAGLQKINIIKTEVNPLIYAEYYCDAPKTVLIYNYFDMLPSKNETNLFKSDVRNIEPYGKCITGRNIEKKAAITSFINAVEGWIKAKGKLPINIKFLLESEEMYGSIHIPWFIENHRDKLEDVDAVFMPSFSQNNLGNVNSIQLGSKGFVGFELTCSGTQWGRGPMEHESHSSTKAIVDSPMWRLVEAINTFVSNSGQEITIDGFFDDVRPLNNEEEEYLKKLNKSFDQEALKKQLSVKVFYNDAKGIQVLKQNLFDPTLNIEGIPYESVDPVGVVSHKAVAKLQSRIVPNQTVQGVLEKIRNHLDKRGYNDIQIRKLYGFGPARTSINEPIVQALFKVYREERIEAPLVYPSTPASSPTNAFNDSLGIPCISGGLGHIGREGETNYLIIDPQEKIAGLVKIERAFIKIMENFAESMLSRNKI